MPGMGANGRLLLRQISIGTGGGYTTSTSINHHLFMFSLIVTIFSIALVVVLVLATMYYVGPVNGKAAARAQAATLINQSEQIAAAGVLAVSAGAGWPADSPQFTKPYLESMPVPPKAAYESVTPSVDDWEYYPSAANNFALRTKVNKAVCMAVNEQVGLIGIPAALTGQNRVECFGPTSGDQPYTYFYNPPAAKKGDLAAAVDQSVSDAGPGATPGYPRRCPDESVIETGLCPGKGNSNTPKDPKPPSGNSGRDPVEILVGGAGHTFAKADDGTWWATGNNWSGALGLGDGDTRIAFTHVPALDGAQQVVLGNEVTYAKLANGTWVSAGTGWAGQLGTGSTNDGYSFAPMGGVPANATIIPSKSGSFTFARVGSQYLGTGSSNTGELGDPDFTFYPNFTYISALDGATELALGMGTTLAKLPNGAWIGSGIAGNGQWGFITPELYNLGFISVPTLSDATKVVTGPTQTFKRKADGTWWAAGFDYGGALGLGATVENVETFTRVPALDNATEIITSSEATVARLADGTWAATGTQWYGELGLPESQYNYFTRVPGLNGATKVVFSGGTLFAKMANGKWVGIGGNGSGQLGDGTGEDTRTYKPITLPKK